MALPTMYRVRQSFPRERLADIPGAVRAAMAGARLPVKRGDTVAVGAGSRGFANIAVIVRDRKSTRLNSSHIQKSRMPSSA